MVSSFSIRKILAILSISLMLAIPAAAPAQMGSDSYQFMEAMKKVAKGDDGDPARKAQDFINEPGATVINTRERSTNRTALHYVAEVNRTDWTGYLLSHGAKVDFKDRDGNTPLMLATLRRSFDTASLLLSVKAKVDEPNNGGETPLIVAVHAGDLRMIKLLLEKGADADRVDTLSGLSARAHAARITRAPQILKAIEDNDKKAKKPKMGPGA